MLGHQGVTLRNRKPDLIGGRVLLGGGFVVSRTRLPADLDVELAAVSLAVCLPTCCHALSCDHDGLNL